MSGESHFDFTEEGDDVPEVEVPEHGAEGAGRSAQPIMKFKEGENGPYGTCEVAFCDFWSGNPEEIKDHVVNVHGWREEDAEKLIEEFREFIAGHGKESGAEEKKKGSEIPLGKGWKLAVVFGSKHNLVRIFGPNDVLLDEQEFTEGFWRRKRKKEDFRKFLRGALERYGGDYEAPELDESDFDDVRLSISARWDEFRTSGEKEKGGKEVRSTARVGDREVKIAFKDLRRDGGATKGTYYAEIGGKEYIEEDWKLSQRNIATFAQNVADREDLGKGSGPTLGERMDGLKTETINLAKEAERSDKANGGENLFGKETIPKEYHQEARKIICEARILPTILQIYEKPHLGDHERKLFLFSSQISKPLTGKPLSDQSVGTSGKGKSHLQRIMANGVPDEYKLVRDSISAKYLYYLTDDYEADCLSDKLLFYDDVTLDEEKEATLKTVTDPGPTDEATHGTVKEQERLDLKLDGLPIVWLNSVDTFSSEQLRNRFFVDQPDESTELDKEVSQFQRAEGRRGDLHPERKVDYCKAKALYKEVVEGGISDLEVLIPYDWEWKAESDRRIQPLFLNLVHIITKLNHSRRFEWDGRIFSTLEDFYLAKLVMNKFLRQTVGKMTDKMTAIWEAVADYRGNSNTRADIAEETGLGEGAVRYQLDQKRGGSLTDLGFVNREKKDNKWHYWKTEKEPVKTCATLSQASQSWDGLKEQFKEVLTACENSTDESDVAHMYEEYKKHMCANPSILGEVSQAIEWDEEDLYSLIDVESTCETVSQLFTGIKSSRKPDKPEKLGDAEGEEDELELLNEEDEIVLEPVEEDGDDDE